MMNEISSSIAETIKKRTASVTLGSYFFFWCTYHWQGIYVTFFVDQDFIFRAHSEMLKNEYVNTYFFGYKGWNDFGFYLGIIVPAILTYIFIWWLPYILLKMYRREQWFKVEKRIIKIEQEKKIQEDRKELAIETTNAIQEETKTLKAKKKAEEINPQILWKQEFDNLSSRDTRLLKELLKSIYRHRGQVYVSGQFADYPEFELDANALKLGDSLELVTLIEKGTRIELTNKGKFFANLYEGDI